MSYIAFFHHPIWHEADGIYYLNYGRAILEGSGNDVQIANGQIGAPILFAFLDSIFHDAFSIQKIIAILGGCGIVLSAFFITKNIFNYKVAILTQLFIAFNPILHYVSIQALNELLPVFIIFTSLYFITKPELRFFDYLIIGLLLGLSSIFRLQAILVLFPILIFILLRNKKIAKNALNVLIVGIFFLLAFSPQILYNYSTHGVILDTMPNYYIGNVYTFQNPDWHNEIFSQNYTDIYSIITLDSDLFLKNYFYNLFLHNFDRLFNFGFGSFDNISIIPAIPILGVLFFLGGLIYLIYNKKFFPKNFLPLLLLPLFYLPIISILPLYRSYQLLPMWLPIIIICVLFIVYVVPKVFSTKQNYLEKISFRKNQKLNLLPIILIIFICLLNLGVTYKLIDSTFYGNNFSTLENEFTNISQSRLISDQASYDIILISEILKTQPGIEESYVMANVPNYSFYSHSNFIYAEFSEGNLDDTILDYVSQKNWSEFEIVVSDIFSFPPDRLNKYQAFPNYLIYQPYSLPPNTMWYDKGAATKKLDILLNPDDSRIPSNFEFLYKSDTANIVVYKIHGDGD
tara:strand:- start:271 stop:1986 length:1716 start_codon:yes stop_codon:yes gene_type:complete